MIASRQAVIVNVQLAEPLLTTGYRRLSTQHREVWVAEAPPDEAVEDVVRRLREREQRDEEDLQRLPVPRPAEEPRALVPDAPIPEEFFGVGQHPQRREEDRPAREVAVDPTRPRRAGARVPPDERRVRDAVDDDVRHREGVVGIVRDYAGVPADGRRQDDEVLPGVAAP